MPFSNPGVRLLTILLIIGILATAASNALTAMNNERILNDQKKFVSMQANKTRAIVQAHDDTVQRTLHLIEGALANQSVVQAQFEKHINQTATAAPIVVKLEPIINENNALAKEILQELNNTAQ